MCHVETFEQIKMNRWMDGDSDSSRYMVPEFAAAEEKARRPKLVFIVGRTG